MDPCAAQTAQELETVYLRQHDVQNDRVVNSGHGVVQSAFAVMGDVGDIIVTRDDIGQRIGKPDLVLNDQNPQSNPSVRNVWAAAFVCVTAQR
jgi:hypothetical protein